MPTLISFTNGLFTAAGTWKLAATGTACQVGTPGPGSGWITVTASDVASPTFQITNGEVVDGVIVCLALYGDGLTGTLTLSLYDGAVLAASGTFDISTLSPNSKAADSDFVFVPFSSSATGDGGTDYTLKWKCSATNRVRIYRFTSTANDVTKIFRTTTTSAAAPTTDDNLVVIGETMATTYTVTMDETATTQYGWMIVGAKGELKYGGPAAGNAPAASTNYCLRLAGYLALGTNATFTMGTVGAEVPRTSTAVLEFACGSMGQYGIRSSGTFTAQGLSRTSGKNVVAALFTSDVAVSGTSADVDTDTGWLSGDEIGIAGTNNTSAQGESKPLSGDAGASSIAWTGGVSYAHTGTSPKQAEVILLTRNVKIRSTSSSYSTFFTLYGYTNTVNLDWVEFRYVGASTVNLGMLDLTGDQGAACIVNVDYCAFRDTRYAGIYTHGACAGITLGCRNNVGFSSQNGSPVTLQHTGASATIEVHDNVFIGGSSAIDYGFYFGSQLVSTTVLSILRNRTAGMATGFTLNQHDWVPTFEDNVAHSCTNHGVVIAGRCFNGTLHNTTTWGTNSTGLYFNYCVTNLVIDGLLGFGVTNGVIHFENGMGASHLRFKDCVVRGDSIRATSAGVIFNSNSNLNTPWVDILFDNCSFGAGTAFTAADIRLANTSLAVIRDLEFRDCEFNTTPFIVGLPQYLVRGGVIRFSKHSAAPIHRTLVREGWRTIDTATYHTSSPSEKLAPSAYCSTTYRMESTARVVMVDSAETKTISVWVYKDASYAGSQPRLILKANPALGIDEDTVLDTMSVAVENWEQLSGTTSAASADGAFEVCVDCDGGAGAVYVDDWSYA